MLKCHFLLCKGKQEYRSKLDVAYNFIYCIELPEFVDSCTAAVEGARRQILVHPGDGCHLCCSSQ